jgi:hypothetical protein
MSDQTLVTRREFTLEAALAVLAGVTITVSGCGGDSDGNGMPAGPTPTSGNRVGTISANHGHVAEILAGQLTAGNAIALNIRGSADHPHTVEISQAEMGQIAAGQRVARPSSEEALHTHTVTFN